jgi:hypothetical protein
MAKKQRRSRRNYVSSALAIAAAKRRLAARKSVMDIPPEHWGEHEMQLLVDELNAFEQLFPELRSQLREVLRSAGARV